MPCDCWYPPECQFYKSESGCKFGDKCSLPHWKAEQQPKKGGDKSAVAIVKDVRQLGCVSQDVEPPESSAISRMGPKILGPTRRVRCTRAALRQENIRENNGPPLNEIQVELLHQRSFHAVNFEDRSPVARQERCARGDAWRLARNINKLKQRMKIFILFA